MFDTPFDFVTLVIAIVALIFARKAVNQVAALRVQLEAIETAAARPSPPPLTPAQMAEQTTAPPDAAVAQPPPILPDVESIVPDATSETTQEAAATGSRF
jgi:hypothetical protein